jgi:hypothetical protein
LEVFHNDLNHEMHLPAAGGLPVVAQDGILLCRKLATCEIAGRPERAARDRTMPIANRQYSRMPSCATVTAAFAALDGSWFICSARQ